MSYSIPRRPVVAFGDSITWGYLATRNSVPEDNRRAVPLVKHVPGLQDTSYPAQLSRLLDEPVLNYGLNGERAGEGLGRFKKMLSAATPSAVIFLEGVNDLLQGRHSTDVIASVRLMLDAALAAQAIPIAVTLLPSGDPAINEEIAIVNAGIHEVSGSMKIALVDAHAAFAASPLESLYQQPDGTMDGLHLNDRGYKLLAETVAPALRGTHR